MMKRVVATTLAMVTVAALGVSQQRLGVNWETVKLDELQSGLEEGFGVSRRDAAFGWTPLMWAAVWTENPEVLQLLLDARANLNARDKSGATPVMLAAEWTENAGVVQLLLDA